MSTPATIQRYFSNEDLAATLQAWAGQYPHLAALRTFGESHEKRPLWLMTISNQASGPDHEKPALWIDANIHATELTGTSAAMNVIERLLAGYGHDAQVTRLLDTCVFYIAPRLNPDGAALAMAASPQFIRSGTRPYPWEEKDSGLHHQDVDGNGRILQMRLPDPNGDWKISSLDPRLMEKRPPHEHGGQYYRLLAEGMIENYDGYLIPNARPQQGLDFNRNFPFEWRPEGDQSGAGPYPASEPEIKAVLDFVSSHPNISVAVTFHTYSRVILRPYSTHPDDEMNVNDLWVYKKLGEVGTKITGYRSVSVYHEFRSHPKEITTGAFDDWIFEHWGAFSFTIELWDIASAAGIKDIKFGEWWREHSHEEELQILKWADENAPGAYVQWQPFDHPQLGPLEIGGWDTLYSWRNPPETLLGAEIERHAPYMLALADMLPHLSVHKLEAQRLADGAYRLHLVVENSGFLPTYTSERGKKCVFVRPVRVELELPPGVELLTGKVRSELGHLEGRSNKLIVSQVYGATSTDNRARLEWTLRASAKTQIGLRISSERAGTIHATIVLE